MLTLLSFLLYASSALALPDVVRIEVSADTIHVDHSSDQESDRFTVRVHCEEETDNPVVVTNASDHDLVVTSSVGLARLAAPGQIGTHSATFRSLPRGVPDLTVANPYARFTFVCESAL